MMDPDTRANLLTFQGKVGRCHARILIDSGATARGVTEGDGPGIPPRPSSEFEQTKRRLAAFR